MGASCPIRGSRALEIRANEPEVKFPTGFVNCAWLNTLENSIRSPVGIRSLNLIDFTIETSKLFNPGPWKKRLFALPATPRFSWEKGLLSK